MVNNMKVKNIMTKDIITCDIQDSFEEVSKLMLTYDIGFLPVKKEKKIIGVITDRDVVIYGLANKNNTIEKCIHSTLITVNSNDSIKKCMEIMKKYKVRRLLVKDKNKLVGVISIADIINNYKKSKEILKLLNSIFEINCNCNCFDTDVNDFPL